MRRWMFILLGALGAGLAGWAAFWLWLSPTVEPRFATLLNIFAVAGIIVGSSLCAIGFIQGKRAGELDISAYTRTPRRNHGVAGAEIDFECPICHKGYRASPLLAGKSFKCRDCREIFSVSARRSLTSPPVVAH